MDVKTHADLGEDVLLPHELLPLPVGCRGHHRQNILAVVRYHTHKENQVLQELNHKPEINIYHENKVELIKYIKYAHKFVSTLPPGLCICTSSHSE